MTPDQDTDALVEADAIIKRELDWVLNVDPAVAHISSNRKIDRKDALSAIERIRRDVSRIRPAKVMTEAKDELLAELERLVASTDRGDLFRAQGLMWERRDTILAALRRTPP